MSANPAAIAQGQGSAAPAANAGFGSYEKFIIVILSVLQFTVVLDFMVLSPLGAILLEELSITTSEFGWVVSAYAFSAGISGLLAAGFADKYDRKKLLIFFYIGFIIGTILCAVAPNYNFLLIARIITGLFGGVIGSIGFAIITDLFSYYVRGRVLGFVQMSFAASQVLGIPIGLALANWFGWHAPFWLVVGMSVPVTLLVYTHMKPITGHLVKRQEKSPVRHLLYVVSNKRYQQAFYGTVLLATGGFMMMPFASAFSTGNLGISLEELPVLYGVTGLFSIAFGPLMGKMSDKFGKYRIFVFGTTLGMILVAIYTNLGITPLWLCIVINVIMFLAIMSRIVSSTALVSAIPGAADRGAFMSVNSSIQQISGGIAAAIAGMIVYQKSDGYIVHYDILGYVVMGTMVITMVIMYFINRMVNRILQEEGDPAAR